MSGGVVLPRERVEHPGGQAWVERLGDYRIHVETTDRDSGRYRTETEQVAYVCKGDSPERLFSHRSRKLSGHLLRKDSTGTGELDARERALAWLLANVPEAQSVHEALRHQAAAEAAASFESAVQRCLALGPFEYLAASKEVSLGTDWLAPMLNLDTRRLNAWLATKGFQRRQASTWIPCTPELSSGNFGPQVAWSPRGLQAIWEAARADGLTNEPLDALLVKLRKRFHRLTVWSVLEEAQRRCG